MKKILVCMLFACVSFTSLDAAASKKRGRGGDELGTVDKKQVIITCANCTQSIEPEHAVTSLDCGHVLCEECSRLVRPWCLHCLDEADAQEKNLKRGKTGHDVSQEDGPMVVDEIDTSTTQVATEGRVHPAPVVALTSLHGDALRFVEKSGFLATQDSVATGIAAGRDFCPEIIKGATTRIDGLIERIGIENIFSPKKLTSDHEDYGFWASLFTDIYAMQYLVNVKGAVITKVNLDDFYSSRVRLLKPNKLLRINCFMLGNLLRMASYEVRQMFLNEYYYQQDFLQKAIDDRNIDLIEAILKCFSTRKECTKYIFRLDRLGLLKRHDYNNNIRILKIFLDGFSSYRHRLAFIFKRYMFVPDNLLTLAAGDGNLEVFKLLCSYIGEAEKNSKNFFNQHLKKRNPLVNAVKYRNIDVIEYLINFFPKETAQLMIVSPNELGNSPLALAIKNKYWSAISAFLGVLNKDQLTKFISNDVAMGTTLLHLAIADESLEMLKLVLSFMPTKIVRHASILSKDHHFKYGITPPMGVPIDIDDDYESLYKGYSLLHHAVSVEFFEGVLAIIDSIEDAESRVALLSLRSDRFGNTILYTLAFYAEYIDTLAKILMRVSPQQALDLLKIKNNKGKDAFSYVKNTVIETMQRGLGFSKETEDLIESIVKVIPASDLDLD